jgi:hypothetical protein
LPLAGQGCPKSFPKIATSHQILFSADLKNHMEKKMHSESVDFDEKMEALRVLFDHV